MYFHPLRGTFGPQEGSWTSQSPFFGGHTKPDLLPVCLEARPGAGDKEKLAELGQEK